MCYFRLFTFVLFSLHFAQSAVVEHLCNQDTEWQCECSRCWSQFDGIGSIEWIRIRLDECSRINASRLTEKLAAWVNEECASFVTCPLELPVSPTQLLIGHWSCGRDNKGTQIRLLLLKNQQNRSLSTDSSAPSWLLGQVVRSRQHLLSFLLHAGLETVDSYRPLPSTTTTVTINRKIPTIPSTTTESHSKIHNKSRFLVLLTTVALFVLFFCLLSLYCTRNTMQWTRAVKGRWRHKAYRKVETKMVTQLNPSVEST